MERIRKGIQSLCPMERPQKKEFSLVIYQRNLNRRFKNLNDIVEALRSNISSSMIHPINQKNNFDSNGNNGTKKGWNVRVLHHHDELHPCLLYEVLNNADILLTSHGFQNTGKKNRTDCSSHFLLLNSSCFLSKSDYVHAERVCAL